MFFCGYERGDEEQQGHLVERWQSGFNAAGFKKKQKKSVSSVMLASEVQILPSPLQLFCLRER